MPDDDPTPITPEGKRAAERVRMIFLVIAAANVVLVAIVLWHRHTHGERTDAPSKHPQESEQTNGTNAPGK